MPRSRTPPIPWRVAFTPNAQVVIRTLADAEDALFEKAKALEAAGGRLPARAQALFAASREAGSHRKLLEAQPRRVGFRLDVAVREAEEFLERAGRLLR